MDPKELDIRLKELQCLFTWQIASGRGIQLDWFLKEEEDRIKRHAHPWSKTLAKLNLAYHFHRKGEEKKCRELLVDCYIPLVEENVFERGSGCDLVRKHKVALKHVLDAMWAHTSRTRCSSAHLNRFIDKITAYSSMSSKECAAVCAIKARMDQDRGQPDNARTATHMDPTEGQWHYYLATISYLGVHHARGGPFFLRGCLNSIKESALTAYKLRKSPETMNFLAKVMLEDGDLGSSAALYREAVKSFPESLYTNLECGIAFHTSPPPVMDWEYARKCFKKAMKLGSDCLQVHMAYGKYLMHSGEPSQGILHVKKAASVHREAIAAMQSVEEPMKHCAQQ